MTMTATQQSPPPVRPCNTIRPRAGNHRGPRGPAVLLPTAIWSIPAHRPGSAHVQEEKLRPVAAGPVRAGSGQAARGAVLDLKELSGNYMLSP